MKKLIPLYLIMALVFLLCGCADSTPASINGRELIDAENCEYITLRIGTLETEIREQDGIKKIVNLLKSLDYTKTGAEEIEGGILLTIHKKNYQTYINVCGKLIKYDNQWYMTSQDISSELHSYCI